MSLTFVEIKWRLLEQRYERLLKIKVDISNVDTSNVDDIIHSESKPNDMVVEDLEKRCIKFINK
jgi:hypothetical protein